MISEVFNIDCLVGMKQFPDKYFDLAMVDPDFGLEDKISSGGTWAAKYKKGDGDLGGKPTKEYFKELFRVSKNQIIWGGNYFIDMLYPTRCFVIWDKVAKMDTLADCEMAWTSFDMNAKIFCHVRNTSETRIHICQKPVALYKWLLNNYAICKKCHNTGTIYENVGEKWMNGQEIDCEWCDVAKNGSPKILDTHLGSQSSRIACYDGGFDFWGYELDKEYFDAGNKRFENYKLQLKLF